MEQFRLFGEAAISIFAIVNPVGNLPIFLGLTEAATTQERRRVFRLAGLSALIIICVMALAGQFLLSVIFHIRIEEFMFGGGLLLVVSGIRGILISPSRYSPAMMSNEDRMFEQLGLAVSPIASPLLAGPGSIVTVMLIVNQHGRLFALAACLAAFAFVVLILNYAHIFIRLIGRLGTIAVGRIMQIFIVAIGVKFCFQAIEVLLEGTR